MRLGDRRSPLISAVRLLALALEVLAVLSALISFGVAIAASVGVIKLTSSAWTVVIGGVVLWAVGFALHSVVKWFGPSEDALGEWGVGERSSNEPRGMFHEREIPSPDWINVVNLLDEDEQHLGACSGWSVDSGSDGGGVQWDEPCAVYLTDGGVYVDIRPDTLAPAEQVALKFSSIETIGFTFGANLEGLPRLVIVYSQFGALSTDDIRHVGVDLRPVDRGWRFGEQVVARSEAARLQTDYARTKASSGSPGELSAIANSLADLGFEPNRELNARVEREAEDD